MFTGATKRQLGALARGRCRAHSCKKSRRSHASGVVLQDGGNGEVTVLAQTFSLPSESSIKTHLSSHVKGPKRGTPPCVAF